MARLARTIADLSRYRRALEFGARPRQAASGRRRAADPAAGGRGLRRQSRQPAHARIRPGDARREAGPPRRAARLHADRRRLRPWRGLVELCRPARLRAAVPRAAARQQSATLLQLVRARRHRRDGGEALSIRQMVEPMVGDARRRSAAASSSPGSRPAARWHRSMLATYPGGVRRRRHHRRAALRHAPRTSRRRSRACSRAAARPARGWGDLVRAASPHRGPWPKDLDLARQRRRDGRADERATRSSSNGPTCTASPATPSERRTRATAIERAVWRDRDGREVIEAVTIPGMAHGTPLATGPGDG